MDSIFTEKFYRNGLALAGMAGAAWLVLTACREAWRLISGLRAYVLSPWLGVGRVDLAAYGSWAVVTGASEGIGRAYAIELARRGLNIVLMSRSQEKLQKVADTIEDRYKRQVLVIPVDFSSGLHVYEEISRRLQTLDVGILVNNVGMYYDFPDVVGNVPPECLFSVVQVNTHPVVQMSKLILPCMLKKGKGLIINISSAASGRAVPLMVVYSASKIFTNYVSDGLRKEYGKNGIMVQCVMPFFVATSMSKIKRASFLVPDAESYARSALATIGIQENTLGCFPHALQKFVNSWMPGCINDIIAWKFANLAKKRFLKYRK